MFNEVSFLKIQLIKKEEYPEAMKLVRSVFMQYEAPDYSPEGVLAFQKSVIENQTFQNSLTLYGAYEEHKLLGVLGTRSNGSHIALLFIDGNHHRQGIGRALFVQAFQNSPTDKMTVHSSPFAVEFYRRLGFLPTSEEQSTDGIRYTPMQFQCPCTRIGCARRGNCAACRKHHRSSKIPFPSCENGKNRSPHSQNERHDHEQV